MARKLRMQAAGAVYHVLSRGNYRAAIFSADATKTAFLTCLGEACARSGWRVHAWCVMSNHYHLALATPEANLVDGMHWLQGTFANRFNRFRREQGHLFQGRYKSLVVDPDGGLGPLCHYIHLNPVRAGLCAVAALRRYRWTSLNWMGSVRRSPAWYDPGPALEHAGQLRPTPPGVRKYLDYLAWLVEDEPERKRQQFEAMSKGWMIGTPAFARAMAEKHQELIHRGPQLTGAPNLAREARGLAALDSALQTAGRSTAELHAGLKSAPWKLQLAARLRRQFGVSNRWLGVHLNLGARDEVSRNLNAWMRRQTPT